MATGKRYYWIKLKDTFFTSDTVDYFMSLPNGCGANYVVLYQMLCLLTVNTGGKLSRKIGEVMIPYDVGKIKRECKWFTEDTILVALDLYKRFGLIYEDQDGMLVMSDHGNLVGSETDYAAQKRLQREVKSLAESNMDDNKDEFKDEGVDIVHDSVHKNVHIDIRDKIIDNRYKSIDKDINKNTNKDRRKKVDYTDEFETFWEEYPRKDGKVDAYKAWNARLKEGYTAEQMIDGTRKYAWKVRVEGTEKKYIKMPRTFLGPGLWFVESASGGMKETYEQEKGDNPFDGWA